MAEFTAAELRAEVDEVHASKGTIVTFDHDPYAENDGAGKYRGNFIAISNGKTWGITDASGASDYVRRSLTHAQFIELLASPQVLSATTLVAGEAFKP